MVILIHQVFAKALASCNILVHEEISARMIGMNGKSPFRQAIRKPGSHLATTFRRIKRFRGW